MFKQNICAFPLYFLRVIFRTPTVWIAECCSGLDGNFIQRTLQLVSRNLSYLRRKPMIAIWLRHHPGVTQQNPVTVTVCTRETLPTIFSWYGPELGKKFVVWLSLTACMNVDALKGKDSGHNDVVALKVGSYSKGNHTLLVRYHTTHENSIDIT